jgi:hypothetical protein
MLSSYLNFNGLRLLQKMSANNVAKEDKVEDEGTQNGQSHNTKNTHFRAIQGNVQNRQIGLIGRRNKSEEDDSGDVDSR